MSKKIAVIGAGLSGIIVARELARFAEVKVFEKSRGVGGRIATRYADPYQFDHGSQFFTVKTPEFQGFVDELVQENVVVRWDANFVEIEGNKIISGRKWDETNPHYIGYPRMNVICKHLAKDLDLSLEVRIARIANNEIFDENNNSLGAYDFVVLAIPAEQAAALLPVNFAYRSLIENTKMLGAHSMMLGFKEPLQMPWQAALVTKADISWVSVNSSKGGRPEGFSILAHSTNAWSEAHIENDLDWAKEHLIAELSAITGFDMTAAEHQAIHRWRYANIGKQTGEKSLFDPQLKIGVCGDWLIQGRIESAYISAMDLVKKLQ